MKKILLKIIIQNIKNEYKKARLFYERLFTEIDLKIIHVGSTSMEGL